VIRLRQETSALSTTLMSSKGIQVVASPDFQDLQARGREKRHVGAPERVMKPVVRSSTHATWKRNLERQSAQEALEFEKEIAKRRETREVASATQQKG